MSSTKRFRPSCRAPVWVFDRMRQTAMPTRMKHLWKTLSISKSPTDEKNREDIWSLHIDQPWKPQNCWRFGFDRRYNTQDEKYRCLVHHPPYIVVLIHPHTSLSKVLMFMHARGSPQFVQSYPCHRTTVPFYLPAWHIYLLRACVCVM